MKRFIPQFQGRDWPDGARVLHVYAVPDPTTDTELLKLAATCRPAMASYPIAVLSDELLHITIEMVADTSADNINADGRGVIAAALRKHLASSNPVEIVLGSPIVNRAGALLDTWPDDELVAAQITVRDALREVRGPAAIQHDGGRMHMSLGYSYDTADSDPLQSALRRISPSHARFRVSALHLLDVQFRERQQPDGRRGWEMSWEPVATIPLGSA